MTFYLTKTPQIIQSFFSNITWRFNNNKKELYLTFDDGPTPIVTDWVLNELSKYNAKATFFCIGKNVINHPTIFNNILTNKHSVGNHTHNHLNGFKTSNKLYIENILEAENAFKKHRKYKHSKLFRPPYGKIKPNQIKFLKNMNYNIVFWDVLSADFDTNIDNEACIQNVFKNTNKGSVIVFHDSNKAFEKLKYVLPKILKYYSDKGFVFKKIEE